MLYSSARGQRGPMQQMLCRPCAGVVDAVGAVSLHINMQSSNAKMLTLAPNVKELE